MEVYPEVSANAEKAENADYLLGNLRIAALTVSQPGWKSPSLSLSETLLRTSVTDVPGGGTPSGRYAKRILRMISFCTRGSSFAPLPARLGCDAVPCLAPLDGTGRAI